MFNKSKKYSIVKCLPFAYFANINAADYRKTIDNQIKLIVDNKEFILGKGVGIFGNSENAKINLKGILKSKSYKDNTNDKFNKQPLNGKDLNIDYKIVSYKIGDAGEIQRENPETNLENITAKTLKGNNLTITVESLYKLVAGSLLTDGTNAIDIKEKEFLFSDLDGIHDLNSLKKAIEKICEGCKKDDGVESILKGVEIKKDALNNFYVSKYTLAGHEKVVPNGEITEDIANEIIGEIKQHKKLILNFVKYFNYTINDVKLNSDLAKIKKTIPDNITIVKNKINEKIVKSTKLLSLEDIKNSFAGITELNGIEITTSADAIEDNKDIVLEVIEDNNDKVSELMKGTIKLEIEPSKKSELTFEDGKSSDITINFGEKLTEGGNFIDTDMTKDAFKEQIKKYLGNVDAKDETYNVTFSKNFGGNDDGTAQDGFEVLVTFKGIVNNFTKKLDNSEVNVTVNLVIDNNADNKFELVDGLTDTSMIAFKKASDYNNFITELEEKLGKGAGLSGAIKSVTYNDTNDWNTNPNVKIENVIKNVTVIFKKAENSFVKKVVKTTPESNKTIYTLKVSCVQGYKLKDSNLKTVDVELGKDKLTANELYAKVRQALGNDDNFIIKKGGIDVTKNGSALNDNINAYSIELKSTSNLVQQDSTKPNDKDNQNGDVSSEDDTNKKSKGCCSGKCSGGKEKNK